MQSVIITIDGKTFTYEAHTWKDVAEIIYAQYQVAAPENIEVV